MLFRTANYSFLRRYIRWWIIFIIVVIAAIVIGTMRIGFVRSFNIVVGAFFMLYFPGWWISFVGFPLSEQVGEETNPSSHRALDIIERITLAIILSIIISSAIVFALQNFPAGNRLNPKNFIVTTALLNIILFAAAAWRQKWIHFAYIFILGIFPPMVIALNQIFGIAITLKNFTIETVLLSLVLIVVRVVTNLKFKSF